MFDKDQKEFASWWFWILGLVLITAFILGGYRIYQTKFEREIFVESHQYQEARNTEIATYEAQLAELEGQLSNHNISDEDKSLIVSKQKAINIMLTVAKSKLKN